MSSAARETHNSLGLESTLISRFTEVQIGITHGWSPDSSKSVRPDASLIANYFFRDVLKKLE